MECILCTLILQGQLERVISKLANKNQRIDAQQKDLATIEGDLTTKTEQIQRLQHELTIGNDHILRLEVIPSNCTVSSITVCAKKNSQVSVLSEQ